MGDIFHVTCTCKLIFMKLLCHYSIRVINTPYIVWIKGSLFLRESSFQFERGGGLKEKYIIVKPTKVEEDIYIVRGL